MRLYLPIFLGVLTNQPTRASAASVGGGLLQLPLSYRLP
jgi:hypothetical protein